MGFCFIRRDDPHQPNFDQRLTKSTTLALPATIALVRAANDDFGFGGNGIEKEDFLKPLFVVEIALEPREI